MNVVEYENDILVIDAGMEFADDNMPGVDYIIPDVSYLVAKKKNIKGIVITHGSYWSFEKYFGTAWLSNDLYCTFDNRYDQEKFRRKRCKKSEV